MMEHQRETLQNYLDLLDVRESAINSNNYEDLEEYTIREQQVVKSILEVQDCLVPLTELYRTVQPMGSPDLDELASHLDKLREQVLQRNQESRQILQNHAVSLKKELSLVRGKVLGRNVFSVASPSIVNITY